MTMGDLGDRMKAYEVRETGRRFMPMLPLYARIDGKNFSRFTRDMRRPYDERMIRCMVGTTIKLVQETGALAGYTQSDEISLLWYCPKPKSQLFFDGKSHKIISVVASMATGIFWSLSQQYWPGRIPTFDCRAFQLPTKEEAANIFLWRELDATKNAITMAANEYYSHSQLMNKNGAEKQEMLFEKGVNFNNYPARFKRGTFVLRATVIKELDVETLERIPQDKRPAGPIERQVVEVTKMPKFSTVDRVATLFGNS